jgi:hypothetical protein
MCAALTAYDGTAGVLTKKRGSGNFRSTPAVWVIKDGKPRLLESNQTASVDNGAQ